MARARRKAKLCRHNNWSTVRAYLPDAGRDETITVKHAGRRCDDCRRLLPLGPSNDAPPEVQIEIDAAGRLAAQSTYLPKICADVWDVEGVSFSFGDSENYQTAWPWDPTRPVAGQYEEHLRAEAEADTPVRHLDGWTGPGDVAEVDDQGNPLTAFAYSPSMDEDLQAGGPAMTDAEVYELWRTSEPDCRDERIMKEMERGDG